ncbi:MAG: pilus assembly protein PilP [Acidobacteria bacterium]|nr:pilus assembly protein PilP [Acidobacteriota bacterium]
MMRLVSLALALVAMTGSVCLSAQAPASPAPSAPATPVTPAAPAAPTPPANYAYAPAGRRDPFVALVASTGTRPGTPARTAPAEDLAGLTVEELIVRGTLQSRGAWIAMVSGASGKVFTARAGDKLADGTIRAITAESVTLLEQVNDPLSTVRQREVRKFLRGGETK